MTNITVSSGFASITAESTTIRMIVQLTSHGIELFNQETLPILSSYKITNGNNYVPTVDQTKLQGGNIVHSGDLDSPLADGGNYLLYSINLPTNSEFKYGEIGLFDSSDKLAVVCVASSQIQKTAGVPQDIKIFTPVINTEYKASDIFRSQVNVSVLPTISLLPSGLDSKPNQYVISGATTDQLSFLAYTDGTGIWTFDNYTIVTDKDIDITSGETHSVTIDIQDWNSQWRPSYLGKAILQFTGADDDLLGISRYIRSAVISVDTRHIILGIDPLAKAPKATDQIRIWIRDDGTIPIATKDQVGGIKVGSGLVITPEGVLNATGSGEGGVAGVTSFNGLVGDVNISIPQSLSDLPNDVGYLIPANINAQSGISVSRSTDSIELTLDTSYLDEHFATDQQLETAINLVNSNVESSINELKDFIESSSKVIFVSLLSEIEIPEENVLYISKTTNLPYRYDNTSREFIALGGNIEADIFHQTFVVNTFAEIATLQNVQSNDLCFVVEDETKNNATTLYIFNATQWNFLLEIEVKPRDFTANPLNLANEVTGTLSINHLPSFVVSQSQLIPIQNSISDIEAKVDGIETKVETNETNISNLQNALDNLDIPDISNLETTVNQISTSLSTLESSIENIQSEVTNHASELISLSTSITNVDNKVTVNTGNITTIQTDLTELTTKVGTIDVDVTSLKSEVTLINNVLASIPGFEDVSELANKIIAIEANITALQGNIVTINETLTTLSDIATIVENLVTKTDNFESNLEDLQNEINALKLLIPSIQTNVENLTSAISSLETNIGSINTSLGTVISDVTNIRTQLDNLDLGTMQSDITDLSNTVNTLSTNVGSLTSTVTNVQTNISLVIGEIESIKQDISELESFDDTELKARISALETSVGTINTNVESINTEITIIKSALDELGDLDIEAIAGLAARLTTVESSVSDLSTTILGLTNSISSLTTLVNSKTEIDDTVVVTNKTWSSSRFVDYVQTEILPLTTSLSGLETLIENLTRRVEELEEGGGSTETPLTNVVLPINLVPVLGELALTSLNTEQFTAEIEWSPALNDGHFDPETQYTANITITPRTGYTLEGVTEDAFTVNDPGAVKLLVGNVLTIQFTETGSVVIPDIPINNIVLPTNLVPVANATALTSVDNPQFTAIVNWTPPLVSGKFTYDTVYSAMLTIVPKAGYTLTGVTSTAFSVDDPGATIELEGNALTIQFTRTEAEVILDQPITNGILPNSLIPVAGEVPQTSFNAEQFTGTLNWTPTIVDNMFGYETIYTASITITPKAGFTLEGINPSIFTIDNSTSISYGEGIITVIFEATEQYVEPGSRDFDLYTLRDGTLNPIFISTKGSGGDQAVGYGWFSDPGFTQPVNIFDYADRIVIQNFFDPETLAGTGLEEVAAVRFRVYQSSSISGPFVPPGTNLPNAGIYETPLPVGTGMRSFEFQDQLHHGVNDPIGAIAFGGITAYQTAIRLSFRENAVWE